MQRHRLEFQAVRAGGAGRRLARRPAGL